MLKLKKVAVTGGLASGKTEVCRFFEKLGAYVVSADAIVHRLLSPKTSVGRKVIALLGQDICEGDTINRKKVALQVFGDPIKLTELENIVHPAVSLQIAEEYDKASQEKASLFVAEMPLLYESGMDKDFDVRIAVSASPAMRKARYKGSDFDKRTARQLSDSERIKNADYIIENEGDIALLEKQVSNIFVILTKG